MKHIFIVNPAAVNVDGECEYVTESTFRILPAALDVIMPDEQSYTRVIEDICE